MDAAIRLAAEHGERIAEVRRAKFERLQAINASLEQYNRTLQAAQTPAMRWAAGDLNIAMYMAMTDASDFPDKGLPRRLCLTGSPAVGVRPDYGVLRARGQEDFDREDYVDPSVGLTAPSPARVRDRIILESGCDVSGFRLSGYQVVDENLWRASCASLSLYLPVTLVR
jgi:hypothetical protein